MITRLLHTLLLMCASSLCSILGDAIAEAQVVISQIYGAGGNAKALYKNDFVELHNTGLAPVKLVGWGVYYRPATPTGSFSGTRLSGEIPGCGFYLLQLQGGSSGGGVSLPTPDTTGSLALSGSSGTVALVRRYAPPTNTSDSNLVDLVGYGNATSPWFEEKSVGALSDTTAAVRSGNCRWDSQNNFADFFVGPPGPHNSASPPFVMARAPVQVATGWNLVSIPVQPVDARVQSCFPDAASNAYEFHGTYDVTSVMRTGVGYWLRLSLPKSFELCGALTANRELSVEPGWNLIAPFEREASVANLKAMPDGIIVSDVFEYADTYRPISFLVPGRAYWVKVSQAGVLHLSEEARKEAVSDLPVAGINILLEDGDGRAAKLVLAPPHSIQRSYDLPPLPPAGMFDVRFGGGTNLESLGSTRHAIRMQGVTFPLCVTATNVTGARLYLSAGSRCLPLQDGKRVTISEETKSLDLIEEVVNDGAPNRFELSQNYPNPFNPLTVVSCQWPAVSDVKLVVYDLLGREMAVLVNEQKPAGKYEFRFDATDLASGVYLYRLTAGPFVQTRQMILVR